MTDLTIRKGEGAGAEGVVSVSGPMTVQYLAPLRDALIDAFTAGNGVRLDTREVTGIDVAGLQLICSAHRTSMAERKQFSVEGLENSVIAAAARATGFFRHIGCAQDLDKTCVWARGVE